MARRRAEEPPAVVLLAPGAVALRGYFYRLAGPEAYLARYGAPCAQVEAELAAATERQTARSRHGTA